MPSLSFGRPLRIMTGAVLLFCAAPGIATAQVLDCVIEPQAVVNLVSSDKGRIDSILVSRGDAVTRGQPIVLLDNEIQRLQVELARARATSDVAVRAEETRRILRSKEFERASTLSARKVTSESTVETAEIELALTDLAIEQAGIAMKLSEIELAQAQALLDRRTILSPVDGVVISVEADPGEYASEQLEILTIADMDPLNVEVFAPLEVFGQVSLGDQLRVSQLPPLEGSFVATITVIDRVFDAASGTFGLQLQLPNPDGRIPAGTRCLVELDAS